MAVAYGAQANHKWALTPPTVFARIPPTHSPVFGRLKFWKGSPGFAFETKVSRYIY